MCPPRHWVIKLLACLRDIAQHGEVHDVALVVPIQVYAKVVLSFFVSRDGVVLPQDGHEVVRVILSYKVNAKIINTQGKQDRPPVMFPVACMSRTPVLWMFPLVPKINENNLSSHLNHNLGLVMEEVNVAFGGEIRGADSAVVYGRVVLDYIVGLVRWPGTPVMPELRLGGTATEPIEAHVY